MPREMKESGISWVGDIPKDWHVNKIKYVTHSRTMKYKLSDVGRYIGLENVESFSGRFVEKNSEYEDGYYDGCEQGDLLYGKLRPNLAKVLLSPYKACCTGEFEVIAQAEVGKKYLQYYMLTDGFTQTVTASTYGAKMPRASWDYIKNIGIAYPNVTEREKIVTFLDTKCAEIDALSADIQKQIEKLEEYKRSVITEAVTKGLDPNAEMKDSGIEWIGEIPANWMVHKIKYHLRRNEPRNPGNKQVLSVYREYGVIPKDSRDDNHNVTSEDTSKYKYIRPGNLVINKMKAWQGSMGVSDYEGIVSPAYFVYEFMDDMIVRRYLHYLLRNCYKDEFRRISGGIREGQWDLPAELFANELIPIPPCAEQFRIVDYIDKKVSEIELAISEKQQQINSLEEYKKSIIYEYVTGKKEVPDATN